MNKKLKIGLFFLLGAIVSVILSLVCLIAGAGIMPIVIIGIVLLIASPTLAISGTIYLVKGIKDKEENNKNNQET